MFDRFLKTHLQFNPLSANPTKWSNCLIVFDHFVGLALKELKVDYHYTDQVPAIILSLLS